MLVRTVRVARIVGTIELLLLNEVFIELIITACKVLEVDIDFFGILDVFSHWLRWLLGLGDAGFVV